MPLTLLFDLDDTLYAAECGLWPAIGQRITQYMIERLGLPPASVGAPASFAPPKDPIAAE